MLVLSMLACCGLSAQTQTTNGKLLLPSMDVFCPHWEVGAHVGGGYDLGEAKFGNLLTPAVQLSGAYHFNEYFSVDLAVSGFVSKNEYAYPKVKYNWYFVQPTVDFKLEILPLFEGWKPEHRLRPYIFAGGGLNISFKNDDAIEAKQRLTSLYAGDYFEKLWTGSRLNPVLRAGVGCDYWVTDRLGVSLEANANMLPDFYNSKRGKHDNNDWRFNALVGVHFRLSDANRKTKPVYEQVAVQPVPAATRSAGQKITRDMADLVVNVLFEINKSIIRPDEYVKLSELLMYMQSHPECHVLLTGYADRDTGTPQINERLSKERSIVVAEYLKQHGITEDRMHVDHKGDRIQPFDFPAANRVTICIVLNKKYLEQ